MFTSVQTVELICAVRDWDAHCLDCVRCWDYDNTGEDEPCEDGKDIILTIRFVLLRTAVKCA